MLKFQIVTKNDLKEAAVIEKRQRCEEERKARIFNAKQRLFGQDCESLEKQISEKRKQEQLEKEKDNKYLQEAQRRAEVLHAKEKELANARQRYQSDINFYRCQYQRKEDQREFDLNDPNFIKNGKPARIADNDPNLGLSSAQVFIGEDLMNADRKKAQRDQQRAWLEQQIREKKQADADRVQADLLLQRALEARDRRAMEMAALERTNQIKFQNTVLEFNKKLADEQETKRKLDKQHEQEDNLAEIYNMITSDMLTENPDVAQSSLGLNKKIAFLYRGMSPEELEHFKREQYQQVQQNIKRKTEEELKEKIWQQQDINLTRSVMLKNLETERKAKSQISNLITENSVLAKEQNTRKEFIDKVVYTNRATDEFFEQFNRTSR